jgi:hypothetical protein
VGTLFINIATFGNIAGLSSNSPSALWTLYFAFAAAFVLIYFLLQVYLVWTTLENRMPIVDMCLSLTFMSMAQIVAFVLSPSICDMAQHYLDGMFFQQILTLLAVMMVYKYWDQITKEDLEFAVGCKNNTWEIKDPLLSDQAMANMISRN